MTITFSNGLVVQADVNGTCYITDSKPDFPDDLSNVTISDGTTERVIRQVEIIECHPFDDRYWFGLYELSPEELKQKELEDTIQMLTDCLLEMSEQIYS